MIKQHWFHYHIINTNLQVNVYENNRFPISKEMTGDEL